jgi:RimJ/RimL family protein N-acetyltransferase
VVVSRTRSEYRLVRASDALTSVGPAPSTTPVRPVELADRESLASTLLDAYRGTVDDEGEGDDEARAAIDEYFGRIEWPHSVVLDEDGQLVAMSFVVIVDGLHYIDPVATSAAFKGRGYGRNAVLASLRSLAHAGVEEVGAVITDGNTPSERLFAGLGFVRVGSWGKTSSA